MSFESGRNPFQTGAGAAFSPTRRPGSFESGRNPFQTGAGAASHPLTVPVGS
jgi:hypothetical protein